MQLLKDSGELLALHALTDPWCTLGAQMAELDTADTEHRDGMFIMRILWLEP